MVYIDIQDFYRKAAACRRLSRQEELRCAGAMAGGDAQAREQLVHSYLPMVAGRLKNESEEIQTLGCALCLQAELEKAVAAFDFLQDREPFTNRLSLIFRRAVTRYLARNP